MIRDKLDCVKYNMLNTAFKFTKSYIGDLIIDFNVLEGIWHKDTLVFITRRCGCELGDYDSPRIKYYLEPLKNGVNNDIIVYEIDMKGIRDYNMDLNYCDDLIEMGFMKRILVDKTYQGDI